MTPFFYDEAVSSENYRTVLESRFIPQLQARKLLVSTICEKGIATPLPISFRFLVIGNSEIPGISHQTSGNN